MNRLPISFLDHCDCFFLFKYFFSIFLAHINVAILCALVGLMISFLNPLDSQNSFLCFFNCYLHTSYQMVKRVCDDDFHANYSIRIHLMVDPAVINTCHVPSELLILIYMQLKDNGVSFFCISFNAFGFY